MSTTQLTLSPANAPHNALVLGVGAAFIRLGVCEPVSLDELTDRYARTVRELSCGDALGPLTMSARNERVNVPVIRANGNVDVYSLTLYNGAIETCYFGTWTADGERLDRY